MSTWWDILVDKMGLLKEKNRNLLEMAHALMFSMHVSKCL